MSEIKININNDPLPQLGQFHPSLNLNNTNMPNIQDCLDEPVENLPLEPIEPFTEKDLVDNEDIANIIESIGDVEINQEPTIIDNQELQSIENEISDVRCDKAKLGTFGFSYKSNCVVCNIAYNDPLIHKIYLAESCSPSQIVKYIEQTHHQTVNYRQVKVHMDCHFMPTYDELAIKRKDYITTIKNGIKERSGLTIKERLDIDEAISMQTIEDIKVKTNPSVNMREYLEGAKVVNTFIATNIKIRELRVKIDGMGQTPEEMENQVNAKVKEKFQELWDSLDEETRDKAINKWKEKKSGNIITSDEN